MNELIFIFHKISTKTRQLTKTLSDTKWHQWLITRPAAAGSNDRLSTDDLSDDIVCTKSYNIINNFCNKFQHTSNAIIVLLQRSSDVVYYWPTNNFVLQKNF